MKLSKKQRHKPFYKQFVKIRKNIQNRLKLFKFKKQKWDSLQKYSKKQLRFFRRYKIKDQFSLIGPRFASKGNSYKRNFKKSLLNRRLFKLFYGNLKSKYLKNKINKLKKKHHSKLKFQTYRQTILKYFESRLDVILYRAKFSYSIKNSRQLILHGHISINGIIIRNSSYIVNQNDLIEVTLNSKSRTIVKKNIDRSNFWPIPPSYLQINYRTCQILVGLSNELTLLPIFPFYIHLDSVISDINKY